MRNQGLTCSIGYGLDIRRTAATLGAFFEERRGIPAVDRVRHRAGRHHRGRAVQLVRSAASCGRTASGSSGTTRSRPRKRREHAALSMKRAIENSDSISSGLGSVQK